MDKFPHTPHLADIGCASIRDDKVLTTKERDKFLRHHVTVEEKIDGANLGVYFNESGLCTLVNRNTHIVEPYTGQWQELGKWLDYHVDELFAILQDQYVLYGEWCYAVHSIKYSRLPDWFIAYDIFDRSVGRFLSHNARNALLENTNLSVIKVLSSGIFTLAQLTGMIQTSFYGDEVAEGLYLRIDDGRWLKCRAKLVRPQFIQSITEHWSRYRLKHNHLVVK